MLTGPVYDSIQAECNWIDSIDRRDATAASKLLHASFSQVDAGGVVVHNRATLLANVVAGRFGKIELTDIKVPFSAGSTNVVISTWTFHEQRHRVTDVRRAVAWRSTCVTPSAFAPADSDATLESRRRFLGRSGDSAARRNGLLALSGASRLNKWIRISSLSVLGPRGSQLRGSRLNAL
jgi:hypothetical protein